MSSCTEWLEEKVQELIEAQGKEGALELIINALDEIFDVNVRELMERSEMLESVDWHAKIFIAQNNGQHPDELEAHRKKGLEAYRAAKKGGGGADGPKKDICVQQRP